MPDVLVWGRVRDVLGYDPPQGISTSECYTLAALKGAAAAAPPALVLIDPDRISSDRQALAAWLAEDLGLLSTVLGHGRDELARTYVSLATHHRVGSLDLSALFRGGR